MCTSAWEAYIEELVRESLDVLRPAAPPLGLWPALNASIRGQLGRFNTPNTENIRMLISDAIGLQDIHNILGLAKLYVGPGGAAPGRCDDPAPSNCPWR